MSEETKLHKALGSVQLWGIAVGLVISGDYFGWNYGWSKAGFWEFALAVVIVAIFYVLFALCFTELSSSIPQSGGPSAYAKKAYGDLFGFFTGYLVLIEFIIAPPAIASALGGYLHFLFPAIPEFGASVVMFILLILINLTGIKQTARFELLVTLIAVFGLLYYLYFVTPFVSLNSLPQFPDIPHFSFSASFLSIPFAIWFFLAVEGVALASEEVKNPGKDIPIGYTAGIFTLLVLASCIFIFTAAAVEPKELAELEYPLSYVLQKLYGIDSILPYIFTFIGLFGLIASLFGIILGNSRLLYGLSKERYLPMYLSKLNPKTLVPQNAVLTGGGIGILCLFFLKTPELITASALGACGMYVTCLISFIRIRLTYPNLIRPYKAPLFPILPVFALLIGILALVAIIASEPFVAIFILGLGAGFGLIYYFKKESYQKF